MYTTKVAQGAGEDASVFAADGCKPCNRILYLLAAEHSPSAAARTVTGAIAVAALAVLWLGLLGMHGLVALAATVVFALVTVPA